MEKWRRKEAKLVQEQREENKIRRRRGKVEKVTGKKRTGKR